MGEQTFAPTTDAGARGDRAMRDEGQGASLPVGTSGRFITTDSVVLAVNINLPHLPVRGSSLRAKSATSFPGGGFTTLSVAAAQGVSTNLAAPLGTGPNSFAVRRRLNAEGIQIITDVLVGDIGVAIVLVETDGSTTTVLTAGVESEPTRSGLEEIELRPGDLVHINGSDLSSNAAEVLCAWGSSLPDYVKLVLAVSPAVEEIDANIWIPLLRRVDLLTMNIREASALTAILGTAIPGTGIRHLMRPDAAIVRRLGVMGCEVQEDLESPIVPVASCPAKRIDTTGVGDTHVAVMCTSLLQGYNLVDSCVRANAAAALMVARESNLPVPTPSEIDEVLASGQVS